MRGNRRHGLAELLVAGPIPAGAGEPRCHAPSIPSAGPIPAGAGEPIITAEIARLGPIPAGAGEPSSLAPSIAGSGPIPAGAGEPGGRLLRVTAGPIPAGAGEPWRPEQRGRQSRGLSPRARGNRIPTGKTGDVRAYPRGRGGTSAKRLETTRAYPRGRGGTGEPPF